MTPTVSAHERPVFLLGTGRCGSTFWQTLLSRSADIWIWGEHAGMMRPLGDVRWLLQHCPAFQMHAGRPVTPADFETPTTDEAPRLAWANGFDAVVVDDALRHLIVGLMTRGLPAGKRRWGFKEIQYGDADHTLEMLLALFPGATIVHTLRAPKPTLESAMWAWYRTELKQAADDPAAIQAAYTEQARRWKSITRRLLDLAESTGQVIRVRIEDVAAGRDALHTVVGTQLPDLQPPVNQLPADRSDTPPWLTDLFERLWDETSGKLAKIASRAGYV